MPDRARIEILPRVLAIGRGLGLVWQCAPGWTLGWAALLVAQGLIPASQIFMVRGLMNHLSASHLREVWTRPSILVPAGSIAFLWIAAQALASATTWVRAAQAERVQDHIRGLIHRQVQALDLAFFEDTESYDLLHRARVDAVGQPVALLESVGSLVQNGIALLLVAGMLYAYTPWLPTLLVASALPGLWIVGRNVLREHRWHLANTSLIRRANYFDWILTERASAMELRIFDLAGHHREGFRNARRILRDGRMNLAFAQFRAELAAGLLSFSGALLGMGWMLRRLLQGLARLGDLVLCYQAFQQGYRLLRSLMESAGQIYRCSLFLETLYTFLDLRSSLPETPVPAPIPPVPGHEVRFEHVTFAYPGSPRPALSDFSLLLPAGRITAIVGPNGAGKSTLIKLLCRLHDPQEGSVRLDGMDLKAFALEDVRRLVTVVFQEPVHFHATAGENIAMGDLRSHPDPARIRAAAEAASADGPIGRLGQGYATMLGKWFGGEELSVGEWQRVALARAFLRKDSLLVLDEPTSAMDPWTETQWLKKIRALAAGRTILVITHRFTTAMHADTIHLIDNGKLSETGAHDELLKLNGKYAQSWKAQMQDIAHV